MRDATFSLAIMPSLPVPHPQLCVEDNALTTLQLLSGRMLFVNVAVPCINCRLFCRVFQSHCCVWSARIAELPLGRGLYVLRNNRLSTKRIWALGKFSDTALQTQRYTRNTQQNNLRFLHGTATRSCQQILVTAICGWGQGAYVWDKNTSARLCSKNAGGAYVRGRGGGGVCICGTLQYKFLICILGWC